MHSLYIVDELIILTEHTTRTSSPPRRRSQPHTHKLRQRVLKARSTRFGGVVWLVASFSTEDYLLNYLTARLTRSCTRQGQSRSIARPLVSRRAGVRDSTHVWLCGVVGMFLEAHSEQKG